MSRKVQEAELLLQEARSVEVAALAAAHRAREEAADSNSQLAQEREDGERLQRRLVEARMRLDQNIARSSGLNDALLEAEKNTAMQLNELRQQLLEEREEAVARERDRWLEKVASLEAAAARREEELA